MKITIVVFSPSGNTWETAKLIDSILVSRNGIMMQTVTITADSSYFLNTSAAARRDYLESRISDHDILVFGAPVYAHHFQYHALECIAVLPKPDGKKWGYAAAPFVTFGAVSSGIALEEAASAFHKSGRTVIAGAAFAASHRMSAAFMDKEHNAEWKTHAYFNAINNFTDVILAYDPVKRQKAQCSLKYQSLKDKLIANLVFNEKLMHAKRYPKIIIDADKCSACGKCTGLCPVCNLSQTDRKSVPIVSGNCIHCMNCVLNCPQNAIALEGDPARARQFFSKMVAGSKEKTNSTVFVK